MWEERGSPIEYKRNAGDPKDRCKRIARFHKLNKGKVGFLEQWDALGKGTKDPLCHM